MTTDQTQPPQIDTSRAHPARVYDWLLGGKDNYPVDEAVGKTLPPQARESARENRAFMNRAAARLAAQGIDQFLDIGTGIPTEPNLHQIVQRTVPTARVVYADNDPIVLRHAEALLVSSPEGATDYIQADVQEPETIVRRAREVLDFERPIALSLIALMHFITDEQDAHGLVRGLVKTLPSGSYLVLSHASIDIFPEASQQVIEQYAKGGIHLALRTRAEVAGFFDGLELMPPGLVTATNWYGPEQKPPTQGESGIYVAVARVP